MSDTVKRNSLGGIEHQMEPGKYIQLDKYDTWQSYEGESIIEQVKRVSYTKKEQERRRKAIQSLKERLQHIPSFAEKAKRDGGDKYWESLFMSRVMIP